MAPKINNELPYKKNKFSINYLRIHFVYIKYIMYICFLINKQW